MPFNCLITCTPLNVTKHFKGINLIFHQPLLIVSIIFAGLSQTETSSLQQGKVKI